MRQQSCGHEEYQDSEFNHSHWTLANFVRDHSVALLVLVCSVLATLHWSKPVSFFYDPSTRFFELYDIYSDFNKHNAVPTCDVSQTISKHPSVFKGLEDGEAASQAQIEKIAEILPEFLHIPFEDAVRNDVLEGWEDDWLSGRTFDHKRWRLNDSRVDFVYLWVNGSEDVFQTAKRQFEEMSLLNDPEGKWISSHGMNRYRDWDELRYAVRSVEKNARGFRNKIQIIVNSIEETPYKKQIPTWLMDESATEGFIEIIAQEEFMNKHAQVCLPTFNSLTIENQLFNIPSNSDNMLASSDDMFLGRRHTASDITTPLFGPVLSFKDAEFNTVDPPTEEDAALFGERPFSVYTSWLLNRRFGQRLRKSQEHLGHALSRTIMREAIGAFPGPQLQSACKRFRGESGFQLYSWFVTFHYLIERHREAMLWSLIIHRADIDGDGYLSWEERRSLLNALRDGMQNEHNGTFRSHASSYTRRSLEEAGLLPPAVNKHYRWTSVDGPATIEGIDCSEFEVNECLGPGFSISMSEYVSRVPAFSTTVVFERLARHKPQCGDCVLKLSLYQTHQGLETILPDKTSQPKAREVVVKALMRYKYAIVDADGLFEMIETASQVRESLMEKFIRGNVQIPGQICLNDDVSTQDEQELTDIRAALKEFLESLFPEKSRFER